MKNIFNKFVSWVICHFEKHSFKNDAFRKLELEHNTYPSLKSVVNNRYYILLAIFAYYSFRLSSLRTVKMQMIDSPISIFFALAVLHNYINYYLIAKAKIELTGKRPIPFFRRVWNTKMELTFSLITLYLIWMASKFIPLVKPILNK